MNRIMETTKVEIMSTDEISQIVDRFPQNRSAERPKENPNCARSRNPLLISAQISGSIFISKFHNQKGICRQPAPAPFSTHARSRGLPGHFRCIEAPSMAFTLCGARQVLHLGGPRFCLGRTITQKSVRFQAIEIREPHFFQL